MSKWNGLPSNDGIERTIKALKANGIEAKFVQTGKDAKTEVLSLIPEGAEVMNMTSVTLEKISIVDEILKSGKYNAIRNKLTTMNESQVLERRRLGAVSEYVLGSVHAVTEEGQVMIASQSGSQLPAYAFGGINIIWVVGAQKIVKNTEEGIKRIYEYCLPLESERAKKAYGVPGSAVNKVLIINKEIQPGRIILILVNEVLGF